MPRKRGAEESEDVEISDDDDYSDDFLDEARQDRDEYMKEVEAEQKGREEAKKANRRYTKSNKKKRKVLPQEDKDMFEKLRARLDIKASQAKSIQQASIKTLRQSKDGGGSGTIPELLGGAHRSSEEEEEEYGEKDVVTNSLAQKQDTRLNSHSGNDRRSTAIASDSDSEDEPILLSYPQQRKSKVSVSSTVTNEHPEKTKLLSLPKEDPATSSDEEVIGLTFTRKSMEPSLSVPVTSLRQLGAKIPAEDVVDLTAPSKPSSSSFPLKPEANSQKSAIPALLTREDDMPSSSDEELISLSFVPRRKESSTNVEASSSKVVVNPEAAFAVPKPEVTSESSRPTALNTAGSQRHANFEGGFRPAFSLSPQHTTIGPLFLDETTKVPATINRFLRDYQREGVKFFYKNYQKKQGGLLGDDMGLGKTIQVIAFLSAIMKKQGLESTDENRRIRSVRAGRFDVQGVKANAIWPTCLIICPNSVQTNWQNELDTWGYFEHDLLTAESLRDFQRGRLDILITSHQKAKGWIEKLNMQHWSVVFVDECHTLKNPESGMTRALNSLKCPSRFGLTGTAIQNRFEEFWTLLDWSNPGQFGSLKHWQQVVAEPIRRGQSATATVAELASARLIAEKLKENLLPPCFLRRTKDLIKSQLPEKRDNIVFCPLTPLQISTYKKILDEPEVLMIRLAKDPCDCGQEDEEGLPYMRCKCCYDVDEEGKPWYYHMLKYIMLLQRCSNHLALVFPDPHDNITVTASSPVADVMRKHRFLRQTEIVQQMFPESWELKTNNKMNGFQADYCGKWLVLRRLMQEWKLKGDKVLLFSMNLRLLDWISYFVEMEGYRHLRLDGSTPQKKRQTLVNEFNTDPQCFVFLISTTAGGTGLNLTGANKVVVFDPHWNPAHDLQAMDRAYRYGQTRDVDVYRLIGKGSLEETIYDRQLYKQQMGRIGYDASEERRYFQPGDAKGFPRLFELHDTGSVTNEFIQACDLTEAAYALQHIVKDAEVDKIKSEEVKGDWNELLASQRELETTSTGSSRTPPPQDSIARVLQMSGIEHTHINDSLLGGSKVESAISKQAKASMSAPLRKEKKATNTLRRPESSFPPIPSWPPVRSASRSTQA